MAGGRAVVLSRQDQQPDHSQNRFLSNCRLRMAVDPSRSNAQPRLLNPDEKAVLEEFAEQIHYSNRYAHALTLASPLPPQLHHPPSPPSPRLRQGPC